MMASKMIKRLEELMKEHGDLPVHHCADRSTYQADTDEIEVYGEDGVKVSEGNPAVEIYIH